MDDAGLNHRLGEHGGNRLGEALEAINDVIAGYSEQIALEHGCVAPNAARIAWLEMRTDQASATGHALNVVDDENVRQTLLEYSAIVRARDGAG